MKSLPVIPPHDFKAPLTYHRVFQTPLAAALHISQAQLSQILNGHRPMPPDIEKEIAELLRTLQEKRKRGK
jgi:hypothetical protein